MSWRMAVGLVSAATVLALIVAYRWFNTGPRSFQAQFDRDAAAGLARSTSAPLVTESDLLSLPEPVQRDRRSRDHAGKAARRHPHGRRAWTRDGPRRNGHALQRHVPAGAGHVARAGHQSATLIFGDDGRLANFISDDRSRSSPDGQSFTPLRFSTPVRDYRAFGPLWLAGHGDAQWLLPTGEFVYGEFDMLESAMDPRPR